MRAGEFPNGARVLRAKIDMASGNINLRDPVLYRILHASHPRTGTTWCIYPSYDFAHGQSDAIEDVTHSICTLEFEDHRPLYDWLLDNLPVPSRPRQYEFARLNLELYGSIQARPDRAGARRPCRRLGRSSDADACRLAPARSAAAGAARLRQAVGVAKANSLVDVAMFEFSVREVLNKAAIAAHGGAASVEGGHRELSARVGSKNSKRPTIQTIHRPGLDASASVASSTSSAMTSWRIHRKNSIGSRPVARSACAMLISSPAARP